MERSNDTWDVVVVIDCDGGLNVDDLSARASMLLLMSQLGPKNSACAAAVVLGLLLGCGGPGTHRPETDKVARVEPSAEPVQSAALPSSSATPAQPESSSPAPKVEFPPDKESCPDYLAEARKRWPLPERLKHCIAENGAVMPEIVGCDEVARLHLERRVVTGKATIDELRMVKAICKHQRDAKCASCVSWMINDAYEKQ